MENGKLKIFYSANIRELLHDMPVEKLVQIESLIKELKKEG